MPSPVHNRFHGRRAVPGPCLQRGVGMIDVLIALVVLSVGLLGLAGLQATGLRYNQGAFLRTQATLLAYGMADRMRANLPGVTAGDYNAITPASVVTSPPACTGSVCSSSQIAQYDASQWEGDVQTLLPSGQGKVTANNNGVYTITVSWTDRGASPTTFTTTLRP